MEEKKFFHELTKQEWMEIIQNKEYICEYMKPNWCNWSDSLNPDSGCPSLLFGDIRKEHDCWGCNFCGVN